MRPAPDTCTTPETPAASGAASALTRLLLVQARTPDDALAGVKPTVPLGQIVLKADGWHFHPMIVGRHFSRKGKPTWEAAIPRWTGGLDRTESRRMEAGERIADVLARF